MTPADRVTSDSTIHDGEPDNYRERSLQDAYGTSSKQCDDPNGTSKRINFSTRISEVPNTVVPQDICDDCRALNLDVLIKTINEPDHLEKQWPAPWYPRDSLFTIGCYRYKSRWPRTSIGYHRFKSAQNSSCVLCCILARSRLHGEYHNGSDSSKYEDGELEIRLVEFSATPFLGQVHPADTKAMYLIIVPRILQDHDTLDQHIISKGCAVLLLESVCSDSFIPKAIPRMFNADLVGSWIKYCASNHRVRCRKVTLPVRGVRVIDCSTRNIIDWDGNAPYVTLSYVWGTAKDNCRVTETVQGRQTLPQFLPCVIKDSIEVTKALGYRYLWVDKFCIAQDSPDLKHEQIQQMDAVYHNSDLTIISAAGLDESYGLPGVGITSRSPQLVAYLDGASVLYAPKDPQEAIRQSHWSTRGWTFQEAVLSRCRLVFTEDQIYFECDTMNCFESVHYPLDELHWKNNSMTLNYTRSGLFNRNNMSKVEHLFFNIDPFNDSFDLYLSNVEDYTSRMLRFADDSLNAFQGILRRFSQQYKLENAWGLAYPVNSSKSLRFFVYALTWTHQEGTMSQRRSMFPSWTWAGWEGPVDYRSTHGVKIDFIEHSCELRFRTAAGRLVEFEDLHGTDHHPILQVKANTIPSSHIAYQPEKNSEMPWLVFGCETALSLSGGIPSEGDLLQSLQNESQWQCILISSTNFSSLVMIVRAQPDGITWERAGMFTVYTYARGTSGLHPKGGARVFEIS
jgi:hypothetical protein